MNGNFLVKSPRPLVNNISNKFSEIDVDDQICSLIKFYIAHFLTVVLSLNDSELNTSLTTEVVGGYEKLYILGCKEIPYSRGFFIFHI